MKSTMIRGAAGLLALGATSWADGFRNPPEGAAALGSAGVKSVLVDDVTAVSHNPAALTALKEPQFAASLTLAHSTTEYSSPAGNAETEDPFKVLPNIYFGAPLDNHGLIGAIGITTPYGQSTTWEKDGVFRYTVPYFAELMLVDIAPTLAKKYERFAVGVGLDIYAARLTLRQMVPWGTILAPGAPDGRLELEGDGASLGPHAGLLVDVGERSQIGLTWRSSFKMDLEGDTSLSGLPPGGAGPFTDDSDFDTELEFPNIVSLGYGVQVSETLTVEAQVEWLEHSSYDSLDLDLENNGALLPSPEIPQDWDDTWTYGIGLRWNYAEKRVFRAGYSFIESPVPDRTFSPTLPDADRQVFAVGWGIQLGQGWWEVAYAYSLLDDREIDDNQNPAFNGDYEFEPHLFSLSYHRAF